MLDYITLGTNDTRKATAFYDAVLATVGWARTMQDDSESGYGPPPAKGEERRGVLFITKPYDKSRPASHGNGTMIAFRAESRKAVDAFHAAALKNGGTDEGKPGLRPYSPTWYAAYVRDPDGNKLSAVTHAPA